MDALHKRSFALSHHRLAWDSVWARFSRRQHSSSASSHNNGKRAGGRSGNGSGGGGFGGGTGGFGGGTGGFGNPGNFGNTGHGNGNGGFGNTGNVNGNSNGFGNGNGNDNGNSNSNSNSGSSENPGSGSDNKDTCPFGGSFPSCLPSPQRSDTTAKQPESPTSITDSAEQTSTPVQNQPPDTSVAGAPSTTAQSATSTSSTYPSNTSSSADATVSQSIPLDSQSAANGQTGRISGSPTLGHASTSLNSLGLPFGADPSATSVGGLGVGSNSTASGSDNATSSGTDVGAIAGGVIGTFSFVLLLLFGLWLIRRRRQSRTAPSAEFLDGSRYPFAGSAQFQFRQIDGSNYDTQSQNNIPAPISPHTRVDSPRSFLHMREKSDP